MSKWKAPEGFVLTRIEGWRVKANGAAPSPHEEPGSYLLKADGSDQVFEFNDAEPFIWGDNANSPTRPPGSPVVEGWCPNGRMIPIKDGWHPPVYALHANGEEKGLVEAPYFTPEA